MIRDLLPQLQYIPGNDLKSIMRRHAAAAANVANTATLKRRSLVQAHGSLPGMHWVAALLHSLQHISSEREPQTANTQQKNSAVKRAPP